MSVTQTNSGRYEVRVQYQGKRVRGGRFDTITEAKIAEAKLLHELKKLEKLSVDNCGKYEPKFVHTENSAIHKLIARYRKRKAERALDKAAREALEAL